MSTTCELHLFGCLNLPEPQFPYPNSGEKRLTAYFLE